MRLFEDTNPRALKDLLLQIHQGEAVLPDFQRDFVWDPFATRELIVSIASSFPAGSILRVRGQAGGFAVREFEGAPHLDGGPHTFMVLDGQQRLTSLYQAFYGVGEHRYYVELRKLMEGADFADALFHERARKRRVKELELLEVQARELVLPLRVLKDGAGGFLGWLLSVTNPLSANDRAALQDDLRRIGNEWIQPIDDYHFPVVTLSADTTPDALCTIFETLNRTGVKLTVFELLTARFWPEGINLRKLWDDALARHPIIEEFRVDPYYVLQAIALLAAKTPSCRRGNVLALTGQDIGGWWDRVTAGLARGLSILREDCAVVTAKWLPYAPMLIPLSALLARTDGLRTAEAGAQREKLKQWFWCAVLGQAYDRSANTRAAKDFVELSSWCDGGAAPEVVEEFRFDPDALRDVTPRQRSIYAGVMCLILGHGARDFHTQGPITAEVMGSSGIDDHHVFPAKFLRDGLDVSSARRRDCVLNRTLIDRTTNQLISARAPSDYMRQIERTPGFPFDRMLESHVLPTGPDSPFWTDDYEAFLSWRQARLWAAVQAVTGVEAPTKLEIEEDEA